MRASLSVVVSLAALGRAFVIPDEQISAQLAQLSLEGQQQEQQQNHHHHHHKEASAWPAVRGPDLSALADAVEEAIGSAADTLQHIAFGPDAALDAALGPHRPRNRHPHHEHHEHHPPRGDPEKSLYDIIKEDKETTKFAEIIDTFPEIADELKSTEANHTVFVPVNDAISDIWREEPKELVEGFIRYHIVPGRVGARKLAHTHTLPTLLKEPKLGDEPQRLRVRLGFRGLFVNVVGRIISANYIAKNGVVHHLNHVLVPPPAVGRELSLLPTRFSTLLHAYETTDFVSFIHGVPMTGATVVAPTNAAWAHLGFRANAFLFGTDKGRKILEAILKYHIVANVTVYSDAVYDKRDEDAAAGVSGLGGHRTTHLELGTLLKGASLGLDVSRWHGFVSMKFNGNIPVTFQDMVAKNGVVQVVHTVPLPPCKDKNKDEGDEEAEAEADGEISVEELLERVGPYVEEEEGQAVDGEEDSFYSDL